MGISLKPYLQIRERNRGAIQYNPFSSKRKKMSVLVNYPGEKKKKILYVKGAAEILLENSRKILTASGEEVELDQKLRTELEAYITSLAQQSLRAIRYLKDSAIAGLKKLIGP